MKIFTSFLNSKKKSLTFLFIGFACALNGQNNSLYILNNNSKNSSPTIAQAQLLATTHVAHKGQDIVLAYSKKSKTGSHFGFNLILDGVILNNHFAVLHYINNKVIVQARQSDIQFDTYKYPNIDWQKTINQLIANNNLENYRIKQQPIWFEFQNQLLPCIHIEAAYQHNYFELIVDQHGEILEKNDLNKYYRSNQDTTIKGFVFLPDPLTSSYTNYGDSTTDNNDANATFLTKQLIEANIPATFDLNKGFKPQSNFVTITEHSQPVTPETYSFTHFKYNRSQPGFEDVNVVYHLTNFKNYINNLGYDSIVNYQIHVDAHGFNDQDQSAFISFYQPPRIILGTGGVDDAEDADVIIHEYGHAMVHSASPIQTQPGAGQRGAMEEAIGDYFAVSYSRSLNSFNWHKVFNWDGHNEFWPGRMANSNKVYPTDLKNNIYTDAEIWTATLMEIWEKIGKEQTDKLVLESLYYFATVTSMTDMAIALLNIEEALFGGIYKEEVCSTLLSRGFISNCAVGISESKSNNQFIKFHVFENNITIENNHVQQKKLVLYTVDGKLHTSLNLNPKQTKTLTLSAGFYILSDNQNQYIKLVIP